MRRAQRRLLKKERGLDGGLGLGLGLVTRARVRVRFRGSVRLCFSSKIELRDSLVCLSVGTARPDTPER